MNPNFLPSNQSDLKIAATLQSKFPQVLNRHMLPADTIWRLKEWTGATAAHRAHLEPILLDNAALESECHKLREEIAAIEAVVSPSRAKPAQSEASSSTSPVRPQVSKIDGFDRIVKKW